MADESQLSSLAPVAPIELAPGIDDSNLISNPSSQQMYDQAFDHAAVEAEKQRKQADEAQSLMNAASPTPLGKPVSPSVSETLSNLGKVEPAQLGQASIALEQNQVPQAPGVTSVVDKIKPQVPQGVQSSTVAGSLQGDPSQTASSIMGAYGQQQTANAAVAKATEAKAVADQAQFANAEKAYAKAEVERAETKLKFDADFNGKMQDYEQSLSDYKQAAGEKVMPGRLLADATTGQRVQAGIFMALSAYGAAISGQENQALKVINNAIDRDLEAQKFNLENKLKGARIGIEGSQYLMSQMRAKFGDDESATLASRAAMLAMTQQQLNINASKLDQATAGPKAQAINSQIEVQKQQVLAQLKQQQAQAFMMQQVQGGGKTLTDAQLRVMESVDKGYRDRWVQGYGAAANGEQAKKFTEYAKEVQPAIDALERIQVLSKDFNRVTDLKKRAQIESEMAAVVGALRLPITGPGILTKEERAMISDSVIGNPAKLAALPSLQKMKLNTIYNKLLVDMKKNGEISGIPSDSFKSVQSKKLFID